MTSRCSFQSQIFSVNASIFMQWPFVIIGRCRNAFFSLLLRSHMWNLSPKSTCSNTQWYHFCCLLHTASYSACVCLFSAYHEYCATCRMPTRLMNLAQELLFLYWDVWWRNLFLKGIKHSPSTSLAAFFSPSLPSPCNYFSALKSVGWHTLWYVTLSCDKEYSPRLFHDEACLESHCILLEFKRS